MVCCYPQPTRTQDIFTGESVIEIVHLWFKNSICSQNGIKSVPVESDVRNADNIEVLMMMQGFKSLVFP